MDFFNNPHKLFLALFFISCTLLFAQEKSTDSLSVSAKIDSIYAMQKKMYSEVMNEPLTNKSYGVEFNFLRLLMADEGMSLSGTFSLFNVNRDAEIAFPIFFSNPKNSNDLKELTIDCHFRYFLGNTQNGLYISVFTRYAYLKGYLADNDDLFDTGHTGIRDTEHKLGLGVGVGYRIFSYKGIYWGTSLSFGRYLIGKNDKFYSNFVSFDDDSKQIVDFEFLKFGIAF